MMKKALMMVVLSLAFSANAAKYECFGTEPFWDASITEKTFTYEGKIETTKAFTTFGNGNKTTVVSATKIATIQKTRNCTDGMSEEVYPFSIIVESSDYITVHGCCYQK